MSREMWDRVIAINLTAPTMVSKRAVTSMLKNNAEGPKGAIVNIASIAGFRGFVSGTAYTVSKHGVLGLTKNTAVYYGPKGIRCNAIMAGSLSDWEEISYCSLLLTAGRRDDDQHRQPSGHGKLEYGRVCGIFQDM